MIVSKLTFGEAIALLKDGFPVQRAGWNGKGLFVFMQVPAEISMEIIPKMQSLPDAVKVEFIRRFESGVFPEDVDPIFMNSIRYTNQLAMVYPDNSIYGWVASPSDILATDWQMYVS